MTGKQYFSPRWKEIIGYSDDEIPNTHEAWKDRIHPDDMERVREFQNGFKQKNVRIHEAEFRMRHKDGSWRRIVSRGRSVLDSDGTPIRIAGSHKDITLKKTQEQALRESENRLLEALEIANLGTWELETKTGVLWWSRQTYLIYGRDPLTPPPTVADVLRSVHPEDRDQIQESINHILVSGEPYRKKRRILRPNGELRHIISTARLIADSDGVSQRVVGVVQDITEQQLAEETLQKAREQAVESSRLKSEFLANMSHEIRTPMNGVIGMAEMLLDSDLSQEQRNYAHTIRSSADGLMIILNDILDFSKIEAGKLDLETSDVDVLEVVEEVATIVARSAHEKGLLLQIDAEWDKDSLYCGDSTRIRQILTNLASNAIKFTNQGSISLGLRTSQEGVQLWVEDTGLGIAEERHHAIFDSFTQADGSTTRRYGGTGLGLAIVRQLVDLMKGSVALSSRLSQGSRFDVFLPLEAASSKPKRTACGEIRVVLLSANPQTLESLTAFLKGMGTQVVAAGDIVDAVNSIRSDLPMTVIVDDQSVSRSTWGQIQVAANGKNVNLLLLTTAAISPPPGFDGTLCPPFTRRSMQQLLMPDTDQPSFEPDEKLPVFTGMRALLAEDNPVNQAVAEHQLEKLGFEVDSVPNGCLAVDLARANRYDVILMDVQMPEMDGLIATGLIRKQQHTCTQPIVLAMTAHAMQGDRERCIDAGMDDYISKPVRPIELLEKLMMWLKPESKQASKINWEFLHEMSDSDVSFEKGILGVYLMAMPPLMTELVEAIRTQSYANSNRLAHTLKGSSRSIGANLFADLCQEVESLSEAGQPYRHAERLERQFADLVSECNRFVNE